MFCLSWASSGILPLYHVVHATFIVCVCSKDESLIPFICPVPSQVTGVSVSKAIHSGRPALRVTWTAPQSDVPISQYQVEYKKRSTDWRPASPVSPGSTTSTLLEALDAGTVYEVHIRAVSAIGNGTWSRENLETTYKSELCSEFKLVENASDKTGNSLGIMSQNLCEQLILRIDHIHEYFACELFWLQSYYTYYTNNDIIQRGRVRKR